VATPRARRKNRRIEVRTRRRRLRYAVVGLGHIAQSEVLPAFSRTRNSELVALVSDDPKKLATLGRKYEVPGRYGYADYPECLAVSGVDAVIVCLPNSLHRAYVELAARCGVHVLCEKPMALTEEDCQSMSEACRAAGCGSWWAIDCTSSAPTSKRCVP
jgi:glucose-fructose oxidoreductase